jgi:inhibitor of KinA sporulation pathway (predicted exonuclease)
MKALTDEKIQKRDKVRKECKELTRVTQGSIDEARNSVVSVDP